MYQRIQVLRSPTMSILVITFEHVQTNHHVCSQILLKLYEHDLIQLGYIFLTLITIFGWR